MALDASNTGALQARSRDLPISGATRHYYNGTDNDSATAKEIIAAPGAGRRLILTHLTFVSTLSQNLSILDGATTTLIGPVPLELQRWSEDFDYGIQLTANTAMYAKSSADSYYQVYVEYINAPA